MDSFYPVEKGVLFCMYKINLTSQETTKERYKILEELQIIINHMRAMGYRERTLYDYEYHMKRLMKINEIKYIDQLSKEVVLNYISFGDVAQSTKSIRAKCVKAVLNKFFDKRLLDIKFWSNITVKVPKISKEGISLKELNTLLSQLDYNEFAPFRDACVFVLLWETGIRIETLSNTEVSMIDFENNLINFPGQIMKNNQSLTLPISKQLREMLLQLMEINRDLLNSKSDYLFLTEKSNKLTNNAFGKRVSIYKKEFKLKNINPHAIRRGFAKRLLNQGVSVPIISKALNHSNLEVTTQYLNVSQQEVIDSIRDTWDENKEDI